MSLIPDETYMIPYVSQKYYLHKEYLKQINLKRFSLPELLNQKPASKSYLHPENEKGYPFLKTEEDLRNDRRPN